MTEYVAYFDDSGHPDDQGFVIAAGFISTKAQWLLFEQEWREIIDRHEIEDHNGNPVFHRKYFEASHKRTRPEKVAVLFKLAHLIKARAQFYISKIVDMAAYRSVNDIYAFEQNVGAPFALVGRSAIVATNKWKESGPGRENLRVVFEDGTKHKGDFMDAMARDLLPCPRFASPLDEVPLQAADLLAWDLLYFVKHNRPRDSLYRLLKTIPGDEGIFARQQLEDMCLTAVPPIQKYSDHPDGVEVVYHSLPKKIRKRTIK